MKTSRTLPAEARNRRSRSRTVSGGTPVAAAIDRNPCPRAARTSMSPITPAPSHRRDSILGSGRLGEGRQVAVLGLDHRDRARAGVGLAEPPGRDDGDDLGLAELLAGLTERVRVHRAADRRHDAAQGRADDRAPDAEEGRDSGSRHGREGTAGHLCSTDVRSLAGRWSWGAHCLFIVPDRWDVPQTRSG